jgi:hypothetical protein
MTYIFSGTPRDMMRAILDDLAKAGEDRPDAEGYLRRGLASLVGLHDREAEHDEADPVAADEFHRRSADAIAALGNRIPAYVMGTLFDAEAAEEDDWYDLSIRRSAIQYLLDDYADTPVAGLVQEADVPELDAQLRRIAPDQAAVPEQLVPRGLPAGHWWWRLPGSATSTEP